MSKLSKDIDLLFSIVCISVTYVSMILAVFSA